MSSSTVFAPRASREAFSRARVEKDVDLGGDANDRDDGESVPVVDAAASTARAFERLGDAYRRRANAARLARLARVERACGGDDGDGASGRDARDATADILATFTSSEGDRRGKEAMERCVKTASAWCDASEAWTRAVKTERRDAREAAAEAATATVDEATKSGEYARAVDAVREMLAMEIAEDDDEEDRRRAVEMREAVAKRLRDSVEKELRLAVDAAEDGTRASIDGARIARACAHLGELSEHETRDRMAGVSATLVDRVLTRVVEEGARVDVDADGALRVRFGDAPTTADDPHGAHEAFETCLRWIRDEFPNDDVAEAFGANAWERLAETCVRAWLSNHPTEREIDRACAVEKVAAMCAFVPPPSDGASAHAGGALGPLEAKALAAEMRETEKRRASVLERARALAMMDDAVVARTSGKAGVRGVGLGAGDETSTSSGCGALDEEACTVSAAADALAAHVDDVMRDATELDENAHRAAENLAAAAADCLDVFRACATATRGERLKSIHASAVVFRNDCHHLANRFNASVCARRADLERRIGRAPALFWPVEPLRALGDDVCTAANRRASEELRESLDVAGGFVRSGETRVKDTILKSIARARRVINRVGTTSMFLLPRSVGVRDTAALASEYARRVTSEILALDDISVEESEALSEILTTAFDARGLIGAPSDVSTDTDATTTPSDLSNDPSLALVDAVGVDWRRAAALSSMLVVPLLDLAADWRSGALSNLGFTAIDVRAFITALFAESELRDRALADVADERARAVSGGFRAASTSTPRDVPSLPV